MDNNIFPNRELSVGDLKQLYGKAVWKNPVTLHEGWNFNSGNYLFTTDTK